MRTVALSEHTATRLAYRQYLGLLAEDDRGFRQAFRTAFFRAMREQLTPRQYEVLWMIEVEGLSCKQCAERLGISPSAVSRHCSRGKKRHRGSGRPRRRQGNRRGNGSHDGLRQRLQHALAL